jgi:hypothetical protein
MSTEHVSDRLFAAVAAPDPLVAACPIGTQIDTDVGPWGLATATFNEERTHRFRLSRVWDELGPRLNFLMLNPSTADAFVLDRTVRRCVGFAQAWGYGSLEVTNVFALRSPYPRELKRVDDPVGAGNDDAILAAARDADLVIAAWGVHAAYLDRETHVRSLLDRAGAQVKALVLTKDGHPGHPLYVAQETVPFFLTRPTSVETENWCAGTEHVGHRLGSGENCQLCVAHGIAL